MPASRRWPSRRAARSWTSASRSWAPNVTIWDDGDRRHRPAIGIDYEGVAKQRVDLMTDGVARAVVHDTATARRAGTSSTGHGCRRRTRSGPMAWNLFMAPGSSSKEAMLSSIERGLWVTRFHYVNIVHRARRILTGMTKDGTFLIEDGRIMRPIRNLRFTQEIPDAFSRIEAIGGPDTRWSRPSTPASTPACRPCASVASPSPARPPPSRRPDDWRPSSCASAT